MLLCAAALGVAAWQRHRTRRALAWALAFVAIAAPLPQWRRQVKHFAQASGNILEQQGEVARRLLAMTPRPRRVLLNDAGAIPYLSELPPIDGLGLGGFRRLPFARASVHGLPAVAELIEVLPTEERPDVMALYPGWWGEIVQHFGVRHDAVRIDGNVICAADEKVIYQADWSLLAPPAEPPLRASALLHLDVGNLLDERAVAYRFEAPAAGRLRSAVLRDDDGARHYDAAREHPTGHVERIRLPLGFALQPVDLVLRIDDRSDGVTLRLSVRRAGRRVHSESVALTTPRRGHWHRMRVALPALTARDELAMHVERGTWRSYEWWIVAR
jgi:hypothetical protein